MSGRPTAPDPPAATRATAPGWRDLRLWIGVLIVAVCVIAGARILAAADDTVAVWAAKTDLVAGTQVGADDVVAVRVRFRDDDQLASYLSAEDAWQAENVLVRDVAAGELIPATATSEETSSDVQHVPLAVASTSVPPSVGVGSVIDVWAAGVDPVDATATDPADPADSAASTSGAVLLLEGVTVVEAPDASTQIGAAAQRQLVVAVPSDQGDAVAAALAALSSGTVTIVQRG